MPTIIQLLPNSDYSCFLLSGLFSEAECQALLTAEIRAGYQKAIANYPTYYRNNERLVRDDLSLAERLFEKIKDYLPQTLQVNNKNQLESGFWQLKGLNERLRYCRYGPQQYFHRHLDGIHYRSDDIQSKLTFMIYLNDAEEFEGGRTLFYKDRTCEEIWAAYNPKRGDLIIFDHNIWHEGEELQSGEKFVLRSDILYERLSDFNKQKPFSNGHCGYVWTLLSWDESLLLSGGRDKSIRLWNEANESLQKLEGHENSVLDLIKTDESTLASCSRDKTIKIWKRSDDGIFNLKKSWKVHDTVVLDLCLLPKGHIASAGGDGEIRIFDLESTQQKHVLIGHSDWVWQLIPMGMIGLFSCSEDGTIRYWIWTEARCAFVLDNVYPTHAIAFDRDTQLLFGGDLQGQLSAWDINEKSLKWRVKAHTGLIRSIVVLPDGCIATASEDGFVRVWQNGMSSPVYEYQHHNFVQDLCLHRGKLLSAAYDGTIVVHSTDSFC